MSRPRVVVNYAADRLRTHAGHLVCSYPNKYGGSIEADLELVLDELDQRPVLAQMLADLEAVRRAVHQLHLEIDMAQLLVQRTRETIPAADDKGRPS